MAGHSSLCGTKSVDSTGGHIFRQQASLRQSSSGVHESCDKLGDEKIALETQNAIVSSIRHEFNMAIGSSAPPPCDGQVNTGLNSGELSCCRPMSTSGCAQCNVFSSSGVLDVQPATAANARLLDRGEQNVDSALSIVPYTEPVTREYICGNADLTAIDTQFDNPVSTVPRHLPYPTTFSTPDLEQEGLHMRTLGNPHRQPILGFSPDLISHSYVYNPCAAQPDCVPPGSRTVFLDNGIVHTSAPRGDCFIQPSTENLVAVDVHSDNITSHGRAAVEQISSLLTSTTGTRNGDKKHLTGLSLPDSLARSFDSSEMDKITQAIVRVNGFGSSLATNSASKQGSRAAAAQETGNGREVGNMNKITRRLLPSVGAFTVQCAKCFKWRLVPSKEQYEQIRQYILEKPFFCSTTSIWQPGASCDDPPELYEDRNFVWAIDKPNIPLAPSGWERLLFIRSEGCSKFADIYYISPSGKKLRSMPDIEKYLSEHPELVNAGVNLSQFSFAIPRALDENYCRKKTIGSPTAMRGSIAHKSTVVHNLGVRSQPWKLPHVRKYPAVQFNHIASAAQPFEWREPAACQTSVFPFPNHAPLAVEPLRAWDPDNHDMVVACHEDHC